MARQGPRERSCEGKTRYSKREAQGVVNQRKTRLRAYPCRFCDGWHVGHPLGRNGYPRR